MVEVGDQGIGESGNQGSGNQVDQWTVLCLPAVAEEWAGGVEGDEVIGALKDGWWRVVDALGRRPGVALWGEKYGLKTLEGIKRNIGGYEWDAMYQQRPRRIEGALIKAYDILQVRDDAVPTGIKAVRYWDLAVSGREGADFIAGAKVARSRDGKLYILDVARFPGPWADARGRMVTVMLADEAAVMQGIEISGQQGGYFQELQRDPRLQGRSIRPVNPGRWGNKEVRANLWASRIPDGLVHLVHGAWVDDFLAEALMFPRGAHDDQVDAVSGAVLMLAGAGKMARGYQG
jgi:predicted phage terminase large subunit-like protein